MATHPQFRLQFTVATRSTGKIIVSEIPSLSPFKTVTDVPLVVCNRKHDGKHGILVHHCHGGVTFQWPLVRSIPPYQRLK
jgi:hypothetical protein